METTQNHCTLASATFHTRRYSFCTMRNTKTHAIKQWTSSLLGATWITRNQTFGQVPDSAAQLLVGGSISSPCAAASAPPSFTRMRITPQRFIAYPKSLHVCNYSVLPTHI